MDGDGASHLGHGRSWVCVGLMVAGFAGAGVALALGPAWVWVAVGAVVFVLGGCLALALGIMDDTVTEEQLVRDADREEAVGFAGNTDRPEAATDSTALEEAGADDGDASPGEGPTSSPDAGTVPPPPRAEATPEELGRYCLAAIRREFGPPGMSPEGDRMRWKVQDAVWRLRDLPPEEGEHEDARRSLAEVHRRCLEFGARD
ncbi:alpha/beta hydrolase [Nocardiopsis sp. RSe5-2]|uniref:Alpha/beta hydrolase n=1 Tax=Nocardiopsis endophytica TaxID=3018445 RepID=A0ABT4UAF7_9ACTN|nr:alpha/beta hydrolase [Nocardiopsis endophytica]MDA2813915.1 alpha/beta hydrolase [Nocardiopsis endophytica]